MAFVSRIQPILPLNEVRTLQIFNITLKKKLNVFSFGWFCGFVCLCLVFFVVRVVVVVTL